MLQMITMVQTCGSRQYVLGCVRKKKILYEVLEETHIVFKCRFVRLIMSAKIVGSIKIHLVLSFIGGVHIGAKALHVLNLTWFGNIARLSQ